ncbi:MAG TPA: methylated-DNA--[protein]-cysteine S-methyltransferase [Terriglobia bacterium]|nr:methylated-DNA--[protein]-cysteine S-methyltransferase [Terriglobia bacterium]
MKDTSKAEIPGTSKESAMNLLMDRIQSPIGDILIVSDGENLCAVEFDNGEGRLGVYLHKRFGDFTLHQSDDPQGFSDRLRAYFGGNIHALDDIPVATGGTEFQRRVWMALREIPSGSTTSYGELAKKIGKPGASRAVGLANGMNPIPIVLPCHRVIGADASLTGYGGGLDRKRWLLEHEGALLNLGESSRAGRPSRAMQTPSTSDRRLEQIGRSDRGNPMNTGDYR